MAQYVRAIASLSASELGARPKRRYLPVLLHRIVFLQHLYQLFNSTASPILQGRRQASNEVSGSKEFPFWKSALVSGKDNGHAMSGRDRSLQLLLCALQNFKPLLRIFPLSLCLLLLPIVCCKLQVRSETRETKLCPVWMLEIAIKLPLQHCTAALQQQQ